MDFKKTIDFIINDLRETRDIIDDLKNFEELKTREPILPEKKPEITIIEEKSEEIFEIDVTEYIDNTIIESAQTNTTMQTGKTILADMFKSGSSNINEAIGHKKSDGDINSRLRTKSISNLGDVIGLNDKFYYIREIFSGNHTKYEEAIKKLNTAVGLSEARDVLMTYTDKNEENDAILQLLELVRRKISSNV